MYLFLSRLFGVLIAEPYVRNPHWAPCPGVYGALKPLIDPSLPCPKGRTENHRERNATVILCSVGTGRPSKKVGEYFHSRTALIAAEANSGVPLSLWTFLTSPFSPTVASSFTICTSFRPTFFGYAGSTRKTSAPGFSRFGAESTSAVRGTRTEV